MVANGGGAIGVIKHYGYWIRRLSCADIIVGGMRRGG